MPLLSHADLLATRLRSVAALAGVAVHVDRKFDLREMAAAVFEKKTAGAFLSIALGGWTPENPDGDPYWADLEYSLQLATVPHILEELDLPTFDSLLATIVNSIQGWKPDTVDPAYCLRWTVGGGSFVPDDAFLIYEFPATIKADFTQAPITT